MSMSSCSSDPEVEAADSVEVRNLQDEICFAYDSEEPLAFSIVSNKTWSIAKSNLDWLEVSQMNGGSKYPSTVLLTPRSTTTWSAAAYLTVYAGATTRRVTIVQEAFPIVPEITLRSGLPDDKSAAVQLHRRRASNLHGLQQHRVAGFDIGPRRLGRSRSAGGRTQAGDRDRRNPDPERRRRAQRYDHVHGRGAGKSRSW